MSGRTTLCATVLLKPEPAEATSRIVKRLKEQTARWILETLRENQRYPWCRKMLERLRLPPTVHDERGSAESRFSGDSAAFSVGGVAGTRRIIGAMSRLRRMVLSDRFFFITCRLLPRRGRLDETEFECLARVIGERRDQQGFLLTTWVLLPDHWHAIFFPRHPLSISRVLEAIKVGSTLRINARRKERGLLWQRRFFDRVLRTVKEYGETVEYIHHNPVKAGLVRRAEDWPWSSAREFTGSFNDDTTRHPVLPIDRVLLPSDPRTRI